jgi:hypothetical protein
VVVKFPPTRWNTSLAYSAYLISTHPAPLLFTALVSPYLLLCPTRLLLPGDDRVLRSTSVLRRNHVFNSDFLAKTYVSRIYAADLSLTAMIYSRKQRTVVAVSIHGKCYTSELSTPSFLSKNILETMGHKMKLILILTIYILKSNIPFKCGTKYS